MLTHFYFQKYSFLSGKKQHCQELSRRAAGELQPGELGASFLLLGNLMQNVTLSYSFANSQLFVE